MRKLHGKLPTELDMKNTMTEIAIIDSYENLSSPLLRNAIDLQMKSARNQLHKINKDIANLKSLTLIKPNVLRDKISNSWLKLSATLVMARSYYG
ncbi:MAG: hypothetical protein KDD50_12615 [Bdellovibrionales bacterium]|nr:hypothetical protein [Bdellovibrionales bacterium]